jgi:hypothetical protein
VPSTNSDPRGPEHSLLPSWMEGTARWGWIAQRGTESAEDAEAAQTIVKAFKSMHRCLDERDRLIGELIDTNKELRERVADLESIASDRL